MTEPEPLQLVDRTFVRFKKRKLIFFSGCDYFRLASHPRVLEASQAAVQNYGLNVSASRMTTGNHALYRQLERSLAEFFAAPDALLVPTGYLANLIVAQALAGNFSHVLIDERSHSSLHDAGRFFDCPVLNFKHKEVESVASAVHRCGPGARIILLTDGMFSSNGSAAPLREYTKVLPKDAVLLVDDAHGAGVLGKTGKGTLEHCGVGRRRIVQTMTLSKAFGTYGGAILGDPALRKKILGRSRLFVGSTPLPLPMAAAAIESIRLLRADKNLRRRLLKNARWLKSALREANFPANGLETPGPIVSFSPSSRKQTERLQRDFLKAGIFPPITRYPGTPANGHFRFVISSEHTPSQLQRLVTVLLGK
jgi:7-keto-8-aminopelargonate synthetase-like enzyme